MVITISISQKYEKEVDSILAWAQDQGWNKSKFIRNAIKYYAHHLQSDSNKSLPIENPAAASLLPEDMLRRLIREEIDAKNMSEQSNVIGKERKKVASKPKKIEPSEEPENDLPELGDSFEKNIISQEEQELYDIINAGLGIG